ncbi:MAG: homoserine dehydrogenase [Blastocatellia bacterium]|nr:homoserine dehydrogenase [Blastocatellia bacterium]
MRKKIALIGLGNIGRRLLDLLVRKQELLRREFNLELSVVAVADSSGAAHNPAGFDLHQLIALKTEGKRLRDLDLTLQDPLDLMQQVEADMLVELSPTDLKTGGVGLAAIRIAFERGMDVVTANKGPLVLAFQDLTRRAQAAGKQFRFSATVTGGLPTLNVGRRDLSACSIRKFEGVVNSTTDFILTWMGKGETFDQGLKRAQDAGFAEADPTLDVDGWDAANKLVIIANFVLRRPTTLQDIEVVGIRGVTAEQIAAAQAEGNVIKLIAAADKVDDDYRFSVKPTPIDAAHPLAQLGNDWQGVIYYTDINGKILAAIDADDPTPTSAAVLEDLIEIYS